MRIIQKFIFLILTLTLTNKYSCAVDAYFCTAANEYYFIYLLNLIGGIHKNNYENLKEISIFDLGLNQEQRDYLKKIEKVEIYDLELTHPDLLSFFWLPNNGRGVLGWYAWKPVAVKQILEKHEYVLWIDAGSTVLKNLDHLFEHIKKEGYFLATIGSDNFPEAPEHPLLGCTTTYIKEKFNLESNSLLNNDTVMANTFGISRAKKNLFIDPMYELSKDLRNFQDDGTAPNGWGGARHDQVLLGILSYLQNLTVFRQDYKQNIPIVLNSEGIEKDFYITWHHAYVCDKTHVYSSRGDLRRADYFKTFINYK